MNSILLRVSLAVLFAIGIAVQVWADELVQVAPHSAVIIPNSEAPPLLGYLARPAGPGPFSAVVVLHWCSGFGPHDVTAATRLKEWGYVALALDSLGNSNRCERGGGTYPEVADAYTALRYLSGLSFVSGQRIAVMGYSMGGTGVLHAVEAGFAHTGPERFRAAIAYYPDCGAISGNMTTPTLILTGDRDDWTPAAACRKMASGESDIGMPREKSMGVPVDLVVYPGATHAFDWPEPPGNYHGHFMEYDTTATRDAEARVHTFLQETLQSP